MSKYGVVAIIPIKAHSERYKNKNFRILRGKALYKHLLDKMEHCKFDRVFVDTDNTGALTDGFVDPALLAVGSYTFTYEVGGNCPSSTDVTVTINDDCVVLPCSLDDIKASISKAVTPNGDNRNDFFNIDFYMSFASKEPSTYFSVKISINLIID